jgi:hypothetical protein
MRECEHMTMTALSVGLGGRWHACEQDFAGSSSRITIAPWQDSTRIAEKRIEHFMPRA